MFETSIGFLSLVIANFQTTVRQMAEAKSATSNDIELQYHNVIALWRQQSPLNLLVYDLRVRSGDDPYKVLLTGLQAVRDALLGEGLLETDDMLDELTTVVRVTERAVSLRQQFVELTPGLSCVAMATGLQVAWLREHIAMPVDMDSISHVIPTESISTIIDAMEKVQDSFEAISARLSRRVSTDN